MVLVDDSKQLDAGDAGKPFALLRAVGMKTAVMDEIEIMRQRDSEHGRELGIDIGLSNKGCCPRSDKNIKFLQM